MTPVRFSFCNFVSLLTERMILREKTIYGTGYGIAGVCWIPATAYAADSIGYVDLNKVFSNHPDFASARAAMSLEQQKAQKEFQEKAPSLDDNGKRALDNTLTEQIAKREQDLFDPIRKKILDAVHKVAKEKGINTVLSAGAVVDGGVDITNDVLKAVGAK
jgi:outer membrane protein